MAKIDIKGRLGRDAELRFLPSGVPVIEFSIADDKRRKNPNGDWETESTTWWRTSYFPAGHGEQAQNNADVHLTILKKGALVRVTGDVHERTYQKDGQDRSAFDVKASDVSLVPVAKSTGTYDRHDTRNQATSSYGAGQAPANDPWTTPTEGASGAPF